MSIAVEHERLSLTATITRKSILILNWISSKVNLTLPLGDSF